MISTKRHIAKTISYRVLATIVSMGMVYALTGKINIAIGYALIETVIKMVVYFSHERVWYKYIKYGVWHEQQQQK